MLIKRKVILYVLLIFCCNVQAQEFGGNPSSIKWKQLNTPEARIIFPEQLDSPAKRISNIISYLNSTTTNTIGNRKGKINLVLQTQTTISNAYVGLGPFRSEFFLTPLQNSFELGSLPWPDQLAIHEFRHVQQYNNFNVGASHLLRILFGEEGQAIANNAAIPNWFFEGDAVYNETNVSKQGRGSLPFFFNAYRSLWLANKNYSWMKLRNGSYKDFTPDHYALGYLLVAYGREKYGDDFWKNVTHDAAAYKNLLYPFQQAIKRYSGKNYVVFRNDALNFFKDQFEIQNAQDKRSGHKEFFSEEFPALTGNNTIVFVKSSYKRIPEFIIRSGNREKKIRVKDVSIDNYFSYKNGNIVYASFVPDVRWGYRDYSNLQLLNISSGKQKTITHHSKYFSPDISEDGKTIVAVQVDVKGNAALHLLNSKGSLISAIPNPEKLFYTYPKFYGADKVISAVRNTLGQMSLAVINITSGAAEYLLPFSYNVIGFPSLFKDTVYFSAAQNKEDKIFFIALNNRKFFELNSVFKNGVGNYQPSVSNDKIVWTTFTADGYKLQEANKSSLIWNEIKADRFITPTSSFGITALNKTNANLLYSVPDNPVTVSKYHKSFGLLNFHSIEPTVSDPDYTLSLISENILNSLQSQLSFTYNRAEKFKKVGFNAVYAGFFPYLSAGVDYTIDRTGLYRGKRVFWNEMEPNAGISIPLNLSKGRSLTFLTAGTNYFYNQSTFRGAYKDTLGNISYSYLSNFISFSNQIQKARQQVNPRFAQALSLSYKRALTHYKGSQFMASGNLYLPGLLVTHSLVFNAAFLEKDTASQLNFSSGFPFSRGYSAINLHKMTKWGVNYQLPLVHPDWGFANLVYFLRVRTNLFYDDTRADDYHTNGRAFHSTFRSAGGELFFDTKWWNQAPVTFGIRYSRLLDDDLFGGTGRNRFEFILPVNIFNQ